MSITLFAFGDQGALFEKTAPWTVKHPQKLFIMPPTGQV